MSETWVRHFDQTTQSWYDHNTSTGESRYSPANNNKYEPSEEPIQQQPPDEWRSIHVIRTHGGGPVFKHWALYIDDPVGPYTGFICNIEGKREDYRYVCKRVGIPKGNEGYVDEYQVGYVDTNSLERLKAFAAAKRIRNEDRFWGCQQWVWEVLGELEEEGLLEHREEFEERIAELEGVKGPGLPPTPQLDEMSSAHSLKSSQFAYREQRGVKQAVAPDLPQSLHRISDIVYSN
ncbi:hypothetical protein HYFRA_00004530 [Hymenoscyphus fraxineus]|uniref:Uncharacterized protein n=1 Tax=Hymenoscyphus fraxineus TaxID=746836 RepID=A0A9N9KVN5_9HELO|nr:hypothetical protein HYFRA_00004530 [Hymenoscyphus fraxineus]